VSHTLEKSAPEQASAQVVSGDGGVVTLRSANFRRGREKSWQQLDDLVSLVEKKGIGSLTTQQAIELPKLYQAEISSLAVARNTILDKNLAEYLENLSIRAYLVVYGPRKSLYECSAEFLLNGFPSSVRALKRYIFVTACLLLLAVLVGFVMVTSNHDNFDLLVPSFVSDDRNYSSTTNDLLKNEIFLPWQGFQESFIYFANTLFRHNTAVCLLSFGLGFAFGVPTILLIFYNGLLLGAMIGLHHDKQLTAEFLAWLSIHGVTELSAVVLSGAAGLSIASNIVFPGRKSRYQNLAAGGLKAAQVMVGAVIMLFIAGILEGGFRQLIASTPARFIIGLLTGVLWVLYFRLKSSKPAHGDA
jgi:uncharacterized membrane protein SpoIIM required for sporulation